MGLKIVHPAERGASGEFVADIVAVHGLNGDPIESWKHPETKAMWIKDYLPYDVPNIRVMSFGYNADAAFGSTTASIMDHAKDLLSSLVDKREEEDEIRRPIIFIAHSLGGIVVKQALTWANVEARYRNIGESTVGIIFFGTPHRGSERANYAAVLAKVATVILNTPESRVLTALKTNSDDLMRLTSEFRFQVRRYQVVSLHEMKPMSMASSLVVEKPSALLEIDEEEQLPVNANHIQMCKFGSQDDETYEKVYKRVRRILKSGNSPGITRPATSTLTRIQSPDNTKYNSASASGFPNSSHTNSGAQLDRAADSRSGNASLNSASSVPRSSHVTSGAQLDKAVDLRSGYVSLASANNVTEQVANLSISPKAVRIPLEVRKSVQNQWETKKPSHEDKISKLLGQRWTVDISLPDVYGHASKDYQRSQIGSYFNSYITCFIQELGNYIRRYGDDGISKFNSVCFNHSISLAAEKISNEPSCDVKDGSFRILFQEDFLGVNCFSGIWDFDEAINNAVDPTEQSSSMSFIAAQSVKLKFDTQIEAIRLKAASMLKFPTIKLTGDFETIFTKLRAAKKESYYWAIEEKRLGDVAFEYFKNSFLEVVRIKLANDDMSCEAFRDAIFRDEVKLRIVDNIVERQGFSFEAVIEEGVLYIQTTAKCWGVNISYADISNLVALL